MFLRPDTNQMGVLFGSVQVSYKAIYIYIYVHVARLGAHVARLGTRVTKFGRQ